MLPRAWFCYFYAFANTTATPYLDNYYQPQNTGLAVHNCHSILPAYGKINVAEGESGNLLLPKELRIIREVTEEEWFRNYNLTREGL